MFCILDDFATTLQTCILCFLLLKCNTNNDLFLSKKAFLSIQNRKNFLLTLRCLIKRPSLQVKNIKIPGNLGCEVENP